MYHEPSREVALRIHSLRKQIEDAAPGRHPLTVQHRRGRNPSVCPHRPQPCVLQSGQRDRRPQSAWPGGGAELPASPGGTSAEAWSRLHLEDPSEPAPVEDTVTPLCDVSTQSSGFSRPRSPDDRHRLGRFCCEWGARSLCCPRRRTAASGPGWGIGPGAPSSSSGLCGPGRGLRLGVLR